MRPDRRERDVASAGSPDRRRLCGARALAHPSEGPLATGDSLRDGGSRAGRSAGSAPVSSRSFAGWCRTGPTSLTLGCGRLRHRRRTPPIAMELAAVSSEAMVLASRVGAPEGVGEPVLKQGGDGRMRALDVEGRPVRWSFTSPTGHRRVRRGSVRVGPRRCAASPTGRRSSDSRVRAPVHRAAKHRLGEYDGCGL